MQNYCNDLRTTSNERSSLKEIPPFLCSNPKSELFANLFDILLGNRSRQQVATFTAKQRCVAYMIDESEKYGLVKLFPKALGHFPALFRSKKYNTNYQKAADWWRKREKIMCIPRGKAITRVSGRKRKVSHLKALPGRGPKKAPWVDWLYSELFAEFCRLKKAGLPMTVALLEVIAKFLLEESKHIKFNPDFLDRQKVKISKRINYGWIVRFLQFNGIVLRTPTGRLLASPLKELFIKKTVAFHLGMLKRKFDSGELKPSEQFNMDETHLIVSEKTQKILDFIGVKNVKYVDVVSGTENMTVILVIKGGDKDAHVGVPMLIFRNPYRNHPLRGVPDDVPGVCYRTGPKAWMDKITMKEFLECSRSWGRGHGTPRVLWLDNASGHIFDGVEEIFKKCNTRAEYFPKNTTDRLQACDSFVIKIFKNIWKRKWGEKRMELIKEQKYEEKRKNASFKLQRPSRTWYLETAAECVRELNSVKDDNGHSIAYKSMLLTGTAVSDDGVWKPEQLSSENQQIVKEFPEYFSGEKNPYEEGDNAGEVSNNESDRVCESQSETQTQVEAAEDQIGVYFGGDLVQMSIFEYMMNVGMVSQEGKAKAIEVQKKVKQSLDNDSVSHRQLLRFLREAMPDPVMMPNIAPKNTRLNYASKMSHSIVCRAEIHDLEVVYAMQVVRSAMNRSDNCVKLQFGMFHPTSPKGLPLPDEKVLRFQLDDSPDIQDGTTGQVFLTYDHFELMIINTELLRHPKTTNSAKAGVIHLDSLDRRINEWTIKPLSNMHSDLAKDIAHSSGDSVIVLPCVTQPEGTRICGICACVNLLLLCTCSLEQILDGGIDEKLNEFDLPGRTNWTKSNWIAAGLVFVQKYINGDDSNETVDLLLKDISDAIKSNAIGLGFLKQAQDASAERNYQKDTSPGNDTQEKRKDDEVEPDENESLGIPRVEPHTRKRRRLTQRQLHFYM